MKVAFLGLGAMGRGMAKNLLDAGHDLRIWNRSIEKSSELVAAGAVAATNPTEAVADAEVVVTMVSDDEALEGLCAGPRGIIASLPSGATHISMSTVSPKAIENIERLHEKAGSFLVAAPVFGGPKVAQSGQLMIVAAGTDSVMAKARPLLEAMGRVILPVGQRPAGASAVKLGVNLLLFANLQGVSEAMRLGSAYGVSRQTVLEVLLGGPLDSPMMRNFGGVIANKAFQNAAFKLSLAQKDLNLTAEAAKGQDIVLPIADALAKQFQRALALHGGEVDVTALGEC